mgnify:FL=1|jgi:hypothetical protein
MGTQKKMTAVLLFALACCLLTGFQPTIVSEYLHPGLTDPDLLTPDEWEELEAEYGPRETWVDELSPESPQDSREPFRRGLDGFQRDPAKAFWADPAWWSKSFFKPLGIDFMPKSKYGVPDCHA